MTIKECLSALIRLDLVSGGSYLIQSATVKLHDSVGASYPKDVLSLNSCLADLERFKLNITRSLSQPLPDAYAMLPVIINTLEVIEKQLLAKYNTKE